ncbi:MAG TPA: UbiD family decarboxylase [Candidatus Binatia bacterium]|nr:UbiD family decarboxylase [Candidatus Binatia bacterium]
MEQLAYHDLRSFVEAAKKVSDWRQIDGADWDGEIGALVESAAELVPQPPMLIFDKIKGYPAGYRVLSLPYAAYKRVALSFGLSTEMSKLELVRAIARKIKSTKPIPPREVKSSPLMENVMEGDRVDLLRFPALRFHEQDGGRYIGTGDCLINADIEGGFINMGTYRMQLHERNLLGLWMSPGQHGRLVCMKYWEQGKSCPVVVTFGMHPMIFALAHTKIAWGQSEIDHAGGLIGAPVEIIRGPHTGLPIPATSEIAIEGEVPPPKVESRAEGPFGEWPGYYSGGTIGTGEPQPVIKVKAIYHRNDPILEDEAPLWPGAVKIDANPTAGILWDQLENAGIQDIVGVYNHTSYLCVVAIKQRYAGHAKQAGLAALACSSAARNGRYVVVVDEDIDPSNLKEVMWAMMTRVDPATNIDLIDGCWSTPLDPRMPPSKRETRDHTNSRAVFYAVRPFEWRDKFPKVSRTSRELREAVVKKFSNIVPFPKG